MDYTTKKAELKEQFSSLQKRLVQTNELAKKLSDEMLMLQGEYRMIEKLEKDQQPKEPEQPKEKVEPIEKKKK